MSDTASSNFRSFAQRFVRAYWEAVQRGDCSTPDEEPETETLETLLSVISHETEFRPVAGQGEHRHMLRMSNTHEDWWLFGFMELAGEWVLPEASARSLDPNDPHDLLDSVYGDYFGPLLRHVTEAANSHERS